MQVEESVGWTEALGEHASNPAQPRSSGHHFQALGQEWILSSCEARIKAQFEQWVRSKAELSFTEEANPEIARQLMQAYVAGRGAGYYDWEPDVPGQQAGSAIRAALNDMPGMTYLFYLLLRRCHPKKPDGKTLMDLPFSRRVMDAAGMAGVLALKWALSGNLEAPEPGANGKTTSHAETFDAP